MNYNFPLVPERGYRWNAIHRIKNEVGIMPDSIVDINGETVIQFSRKLTKRELTKVKNLMKSNPQLPPPSGTVLRILDIWEKFDDFKKEVELPDLKLYYGETVAGSGNIDSIELHHPTPLEDRDIDKIKIAYNNLFKG